MKILSLGDIEIEGKNINQLDILICIIPKVNQCAPTVGPALLKSHLLAAGFSCEVRDFNIQMYNYLKSKDLHNKYYKNDDRLFSSRTPDEHPEFSQFRLEHDELFESWIQQIKEKNPKYVGMSILSRVSHSIAISLSKLLQKKLPHVKIIWGGPRVESLAYSLKKSKPYDHFIAGDADFSIVEFFKGNRNYSGIDSHEYSQVLDLDSLLVPNYDDICWQEYDEEDIFPNVIYITGSRGCVRKCTFCNVSDIWPKFKYRSASCIGTEIRELIKKYNRKTFRFTDSLINGSRIAFKELLLELKKIKIEHPDFGWSSQWIMRPEKYANEEEFQLIKESGCLQLEIGLESFDEEIRYHMGKKFSNKDVDWCLKMLNKFKIPHVLLMIVGYPLETREVHLATLSKIKELKDKGYLTAKNEHNRKLLVFSFGKTMMLDINLPVWDSIRDEVEFKNSFDWTYKDNNFLNRIQRLKEINELIVELCNVKKMNWNREKSIKEYEGILKGEG